MTRKAFHFSRLISIHISLLFLGGGLSSLTAQNLAFQRFPDSYSIDNTITIGLLKGEHDPKDISVKLRQGEFKVVGNSDNAMPFEVSEYSSEWLGIRLKSTQPQAFSSVKVIFFRFFETDSDLLRALLLGKVDYSVFRGRKLLDKYLPDLQGMQPIPIRLPNNTVDMILYNLNHPVLKSTNVRKAISFSIKKNEIEEKILQNQGEVAKGSPYEPESDYYPPDEGIEHYNYSPRRAIMILKRDGWALNANDIFEKNGQKLTFRLAFKKGIQLDRTMATKIRRDLNLRGMEVILIAQTKVELKNNFASGDFDAVLWHHQFEESPFALYDFFVNPETSFIKFENSTFTRAYKRLLRLPEDARKPEIDRLQIITNQKCIATYLSFRWYLYHLFNINRLTNYYYDGKLNPFDEWQIGKKN
ncbi:MAG: hypothetical protein DWQ05_05550 [Calditrichaeota bacterium]|nr:MAG: hypothetical protein DWQ05_05550 [Calditrichota bacterium]